MNDEDEIMKENNYSTNAGVSQHSLAQKFPADSMLPEVSHIQLCHLKHQTGY
jgi:hypothetical protein